MSEEHSLSRRGFIGAAASAAAALSRGAVWSTARRSYQYLANLRA
jgi:hypothetical protein